MKFFIKYILFATLICKTFFCNAQITDSLILKKDSATTIQPNTKRLKLITTVNITGYGTALFLLNQTWYKNFPRSSFHFFNDAAEWSQMDKIGHAWTAYSAGLLSASMWKWTGLSQRKSIILGSVTSASYLTVIEILDGFSSKWGFSLADMGANIFGSGLLISQELLWREQRIQIKFSFHKNNYSDPVLNNRADALFGKPWYERMLKDYNAQAYWLSANLYSFNKKIQLPKWFNIAVGYSADGMFGGFENKWRDEKTGIDYDRTDIKRYRKFFIAPDIDFTKIKTNKKWLKTLFSFLNAFKCPAPALEINTRGQLIFHFLYF